jgi:hypothetical protein
MAAVRVRVVGPAIARPVALGERPVEQNELRFMLSQCLEQARRLACQTIDHCGGIGVGSADR